VADGMGCDTEHMTRRVATSSTNSTHRRCNHAVSTVKQVDGQHTVGLGPQELPPGDRRPRRCGINTGAVQDGPHRAGSDPVPVAKPAQLAVDAAVPQVGFSLASHTARADLLRDPRTARPAWVAPTAPDPVPAWAPQQPRQSSQDRSVGPVEPWPGDLPPQHRDLVPEHRQRSILGRRVRASSASHPSPGRTADTAVVGSSADHGGPMASSTNPQHSPHDRRSGTHRLVVSTDRGGGYERVNRRSGTNHISATATYRP
jgi:hypothetical protein